ncbi:MAG: site-2 protease family protein [Polyangiaceae bacterium]|nr:site-2 protease family protein [Polyangiaceae bacterium]MCW5789988.1 site-2 protease family protein [Polyangiaceae bacterium]
MSEPSFPAAPPFIPPGSSAPTEGPASGSALDGSLGDSAPSSKVRGSAHGAPMDELEPPFAPKARTNVLLFFATVASVFYVGSAYAAGHFRLESFGQALAAAWIYAVPLMAILLAHEFGHYIAARIHKVPASLPYFLPLPILNPFGTLGAVIVMPERIRSRNALMDIGAAGPIAGMVVAIPLMALGIHLSEVVPSFDYGLVIHEGDSLLYWLLKRLVLGPMPEGYDIQTHPLALAAWVGFFVTFLNLFPYSQLDGGHIAYALLGERQNRFARWVRYAPLVLAVYNFAAHGVPAISAYLASGPSGNRELAYLAPIATSVNWVFLFGLLWFMSRRVGPGHPPVDDERLSPGRALVGIVSLVIFLLVFIPTPWMQAWLGPAPPATAEPEQASHARGR